VCYVLQLLWWRTVGIDRKTLRGRAQVLHAPRGLIYVVKREDALRQTW
jgi:hypothetical protein